MRVESVLGKESPASLTKQANAPGKGAKSFTETLTDVIEQVNGLQKEADALAVQVATGGSDNVHQAMIAMEKAVLALEFAVQVRNKAIEAYQELMRTQI